VITVLLSIIVAYFFGSVPWGFLLCRIVRKIDIRKYGSGNIGATNVYRVAGGPLAVSVLILDISKGFLPVLLAKSFLYTDSLYLILVGIASILGHNFSVFLRGKGGKGVSTSFGVIIGLFPVPALITLLVWIITIVITRYVSLGAIIGALSLPVLIPLFHKDLTFTLSGIIISLLIIYTHRTNIKRLIEKKENRVKLPWEKL
jgi:acyl phosphate:glycerol-3-phosphate acyltransferase